jgi:hypothetical protein
MRLLLTLARWEMITLSIACAGVIGWKLFESGSLSGLLRSADGTFSPGRVQLLVLTIGMAMQFLLGVLHDPSHLPAVPMGLVMATGGSQAIYLGAKAWSIFGNPRNGLEGK